MNSFINPKKIISESAIGNAAVVADFGFGTGNFLTALINEVGSHGKVYAFDIQKDIVDKVAAEFKNSYVKNIEFLTTDLEKEKSTKIKAESVDFVLISSLFFQVDKKEEVVIEAFRILRPKGRVLFIDWRESFSGLGPNKENVFTEIEAIKIFKNNTFSLDRRINAGDYHYALLFRK